MDFFGLSENNQGLSMKDVCSEKQCCAQEPQSYPVYLQCYLPITIFHIGQFGACHSVACKKDTMKALVQTS